LAEQMKADDIAEACRRIEKMGAAGKIATPAETLEDEVVVKPTEAEV